jgi:hypothetical protein
VAQKPSTRGCEFLLRKLDICIIPAPASRQSVADVGNSPLATPPASVSIFAPKVPRPLAWCLQPPGIASWRLGVESMLLGKGGNMQPKQIVYRGVALTLLSLPLSLVAATAGAAGNTQLQDWTQMHEQVVSVDRILRGDVSNGLNTFASVSDLVLTPDEKAVEYVLYETSYPYTLIGSTDGFVSYDNVEIVNGGALHANLVIKDVNVVRAPDTLKLTAAQAQDRLVTGLIGSKLYFSDGDSRKIKDMLIDRHSGKVMAYVIDLDPDAVFTGQPRAIPATDVSISNGRVSADVDLLQIEEMHEYNPSFL